MTKDLIIGAIITFVLVVGLFLIATEGLKMHEIMECQKWQEQSKEFNKFTATSWQVDQCKNYNINL